MGERAQFLNNVKKWRIDWIHAQNRKGITAFPFDVQVFKLNDNTAIVTLPGEMFVEHQLTIKNFSPFDNTMVIEMLRELKTGKATHFAYNP